MNQAFRGHLKNSCKGKFKIIGTSGVGQIKLLAGNKQTQSTGFPENVAKRELNTSVNISLKKEHNCWLKIYSVIGFFKKYCFFYVFQKIFINQPNLLHCDQLPQISFTSTKILIKNHSSQNFIHLSLFFGELIVSYGVKLFRCGYLLPNFHEHVVHWNYGKNLQSII